MLKINKFSATEDMYVCEQFESYRVGDIISGGKIEKTKAIKLWLSSKIKNVGIPNYTQEQLEAMDFKDLKKIAQPFGITDRSKKGIIKEIMVVV